MSALPGVAVVGPLEREAELARVERVFDRVGAGVGAVAVVEGPAGIGKSELLGAVGANARARGFGVLRARGSEFEADIAFGVARQLFEPMLRAASAQERRRLLYGVARIGARALGVEEGEALADQFAAIHGLFWLCANQAERGPLVVAVDDVQWADDPSLAWLGYVARRAGDLPLALVVGLRSGDPGAERSELARLVADGGVERITLGPLSATVVEAIVRFRLDERAEKPFCSACWELTGGNPLLVCELVAAAREQGLTGSGSSVGLLHRIAPAAVGTSVLTRLGRLGEEAAALARAVAILGAGAEVALAARLADLDPPTAELTADRLSAAQILAPDRPLDFFHPVIGAAVLEDIAPGARRVAHRRAAELVDRGGEASLARVAAHLLACGPAGDEWVVERLCTAASEALELGAPDVAARYLRRALSEPPADARRAALLLALGTAEWRAQEPQAITHLEQAFAATGKDLDTVWSAASLLASAYATANQPERSIEVLEQALAAVGDTDAPLGVTFATGIALVGMLNGHTASAGLRRAEALRCRIDALSEASIQLPILLAYDAVRANDAALARRVTDQAFECEPYPPPYAICNILLSTLNSLEQYDGTQRLSEELLARARRRSATQEIAAILPYRAHASRKRGALADAEADAGWALERARGIHVIHAVGEVIHALIERDALDAAQQVAEQCPDPRDSDSVMMLWFVLARGALRAAQARLKEALDDFLDAGQRCQVLGMATFSVASWRTHAAPIHAALGNSDEAHRLAREQLRLARAFGQPEILGVSLRAAGLVEGGETGLELLREAVQTLECSQSRLELARAVSDYGGALRRAGCRVKARAQLERALDLAHHLGARRIANQAREELTAAGAKPRRDAITGRDALTAAELRVARLAAHGLTNREIAQALFITTRTAKVHLGRVYRKLEITRRGQLADALAAVVKDPREHPSASPTAIS